MAAKERLVSKWRTFQGSRVSNPGCSFVTFLNNVIDGVSSYTHWNSGKLPQNEVEVWQIPHMCLIFWKVGIYYTVNIYIIQYGEFEVHELQTLCDCAAVSCDVAFVQVFVVFFLHLSFSQQHYSAYSEKTGFWLE